MDDSTRLQVASLHETAQRQQARWQWEGARDTLRRAARVARDADQTDGVQLLSTERMLAEVLRELGDLREAQRLATSLVPRCEEALGPEHPGTVRARAVLATITYDLGDLDAAYALSRRVLESGKGTDGPAARAVLLTQATLSRMYRDRGEHSLALTTLRAAHDTFRRRYGDEDLDTLRMAAELAGMHLATGDRPAARQLLTRAHHRARALLGGGHPFTVRLEERLADVEPPMPTHPEPEGGRHHRKWRRGGRLDSLAGRASQPPPVQPPPPTRQSPLTEQAPPTEQPPGRPSPLSPRQTTPSLRQRRNRPRPLPRLDARLRRHRNPLLATGLALLAVGGICAAAFATPAAVRQLRRAGESLELRSPAPSPTAATAPANLALSDHGASVTVSWNDPSHGTATAVVSLSRNGEPVGAVVSLARGSTSYTATGLNPSGDYCFLVALLAPDATSARPTSVCTTRSATAVSPTPSAR